MTHDRKIEDARGDPLDSLSTAHCRDADRNAGTSFSKRCQGLRNNPGSDPLAASEMDVIRLGGRRKTCKLSMPIQQFAHGWQNTLALNGQLPCLAATREPRVFQRGSDLLQQFQPLRHAGLIDSQLPRRGGRIAVVPNYA